MLIDWFTVCAQLINFLILVWLMKRYLYKPILNAIDTREKRIANEISTANAKKAEAQKEREEFKQKNDEFDKHHATLVSKATKEVEAERKRLLAGAKQESDDLRAEMQSALKSEYDGMIDDISRKTRMEVFSVARKTLSDLASASLEEQMAEVFVRRLNALSDKEKLGMQSAFSGSTGTATVRSTFELPVKNRTSIEKAIKDVGQAKIPVEFETAPDQISGIELTANGWKVAWSIAEYLNALDNRVAVPTNVPTTPEPVKK
jgi:F-type H+-transporting ATPase subunit b